MPALPDFNLETYLSKWEFTAKYHMTASDAESMSLADLLQLGTDKQRDDFHNLWLGYTQTFGDPELRQIIAHLYSGLNAKDILCFAGAAEGIYIAMHVLLSKDDHAIIITPNYQSAETIPLSICEVTGVALDANDHWSLDIDRLRSEIRPNTKLISINFPHNPTGKILEKDRFDALIELCREHGIWLFSDEVYRGLNSNQSQKLPAVAEVYEKGLSVAVTSKALGLPGLRIGWIACQDSAVISQMERMKHYISICNSAPSESLTKIALQNSDLILARNNALIANNLNHLDEFFGEFADLFEWYRPDGGCIGYPKYKGAEGVETFTQKLVEEVGVLLLPASIYRSELNPTPDNRFRIGFGRSNIEVGIAVMRAYLRKNAA
ncbi:aminotransferase class I/II-fold pyridoxal phosphate-dependent enzyme [Pseudochrobactrum sp. MP213Fo]|uniref:aminotransferase class I/II-fold pyridoxal phosphate-dependent enzyme n=1 Tax=Pseudochrobactrum sp. MP213Fo TaxID=3022250 RepID=UPI003B9F93E8